MSKTLVTGGTGFLGYHIVRRLLKERREVRLLVRSVDKARALFSDEVEVCKGDITDPASIERALQGVSTVFHTAGMPNQWVSDPAMFSHANALGTAQMVRAALRSEIGKFIYVSTIETFQTRRVGVYDETDMDPNPQRSAYARSKQLADRTVWDAIQEGLPAIIVHPAAMYGPHPTECHWFMRFILDLRKGQIPYLPPGGLPMVHVEDVAEGCLQAERKSGPGQRFILSDRYVSFGEMGASIAEEFHLPHAPKTMPRWLGWLMVYAGAVGASVTRKPPLLLKSLFEFFCLESRPSSLKAREVLGWSPRPFDEGLRKTIQFLLRGETNPQGPLTCKFCSYLEPSPRSTDLGRAPGNTQRFKNTIFHLWRCPQCSSVQNIDPVDFADVYRDYPLNKRKLDIFAQGTLRNLLRRLQRAGLRTEDRVLDYGCGNGIFVDFMKQRGYHQVKGYDPFYPAYSEPPGEGDLFDWVVINDTIEHGDDFHAMVREAARYLTPAGLIYIGTPDTTGLHMADLEPQITKLHQPFHRVLVSSDSLKQMGPQLGFDVVGYYRRSYHDTLRPFSNYRFLDELLKALGHDIDRTLDPNAGAIVLRRPWLLFYAFFGYFFPSAYEPAVILKRVRHVVMAGATRARAS